MVFEQIEELREDREGERKLNEIRNTPTKAKGELDVDDAGSNASKETNKYNDTPAGKLAGDSRFENFTIAVICLNALWIGYDTEYTATIGKAENLYETPPEFIIMENFFAIFFTFEMGARAVGYRDKTKCIWDAWFVFDSTLVILMIVETWIMPAAGGGGLGGLGVLRLLRLLRITRMAKLMRAIPEIMTIVKGLMSATRAVGTTAILLILVTYTFAIIFTSSYHQGIVQDGDESDNAMVNFGSMGKSAFSLIIMGAIFDDLTYCTDSIRESGNTMMLMVFIVYMLLTGFTVLNMLIGILAEVVTATSDGEKRQAEVSLLTESIQSIITQLDDNEDGLVSATEFEQMIGHKDLEEVLADLNIKAEQWNKYGELVFSSRQAVDAKRSSGKEEPSISYDELVRIIYKLRPGTNVNALDLACFEHGVGSFLLTMDTKMKKLDKMSSVVSGGNDPEERRSLMRSSTFTCPTPKSTWAGLAPNDTPLAGSFATTPETPESQENQATSKNRKSPNNNKVSFFPDDVSKEIPAEPKAAAEPSGRPSSSGDPRWRRLATSDILAEVQRRLNISDAGTEALRNENRAKSASGAADAATSLLPGVPGPSAD